MNAPAPQPNLDKGWSAELHLGFALRQQRSSLIARHQRGPLAVQRTFYPEGPVCHTYLLHPPGGVVGGDRLDIRCRVESGAHALLTTPGATKYYRSAGATAEQLQQLEVAAGATLEWLPQENIFFPGAEVRLRTRIALANGARHCGWEIQCLGRPANRERFERGRIDSLLSIEREGQPLLRDRLCIDGAADLDHPSGLRGHPVLASLWAAPADEALLEAAREQVEDPLLGLTLLDDLLVLRALGADAGRIREQLTAVWRLFREQSLGMAACRPRIWAT